VDCGNGGFAAICRDPHKVCPDLPLTSADLVVHELDIGGFTKQLATSLGLRWQAPARRGDSTWAIGLSERRDTRNQPVFLIVLPQSGRFQASLERLLFDVPGPFVVVAPTDRHRSVEVQERLQSRGIGFMSLEDHLAADGVGQFLALHPQEEMKNIRPTPVEDRPRVVKEFLAVHRCKVKGIQEAAGVDEADYYKWLHGKIQDHYSTAVAIERVLLHGLPDRREGKPRASIRR